MGHEGVVMWRILRQFHEAYPERSICLTTHAIGPMEGQVLLCDLTDSVP